MKFSVCVDASLVLRTLVNDEFSDEAENLIKGWIMQGATLLAPSIFEFEVVSTLRRYVHLNRISPEQGQRAYNHFWLLDIEIVRSHKVIPLAWKLARKYNRPRIYDTSYLAVAHLRKCEFWTMDRKLYNAVHKKLSWVRILAK